MASQLVALDESKSNKHPIISVGGVVVALDRLMEIESTWKDAKRDVGLHEWHVKYSRRWKDLSHRRELITAVGQLPLRAVVALQGYSIVTFTPNRTGKELLHDHIDRWMRELPDPYAPIVDDQSQHLNGR